MSAVVVAVVVGLITIGRFLRPTSGSRWFVPTTPFQRLQG